MSELKHTQRGFAYIEFYDHYDNKCSLQKSSLAFEDAIWFGIDDANPQVMAKDAKSVGVVTDETTGWVPYDLPKSVSLTTRMHLTQDQVRELLPTLIHFAETGDVLAPADCRAQPEANADADDARRYRFLRDMDMLANPSVDLAEAFQRYTGGFLDGQIDDAIAAFRQSTPKTDAPQAKGSEVTCES